MQINGDFSQSVVILPEHHVWHPSPVKGVKRLMLERDGSESGLATSLVCYDPHARFYSHNHGGGEEFLVLSGSFHDEHGDYPTGYYIRNPMGTSHSPWAGAEGAMIFVKLHQFHHRDKRRVSVNTQAAHWIENTAEGVIILVLHIFEHEITRLVRMGPSIPCNLLEHNAFSEWLVLEGSLYDELGDYPKGTWIRHPLGFQSLLYAGSEGATVYVKTHTV